MIFDKVDSVLEEISSSKWKPLRNLIYITLCIISLIAVVMLAFIPICVSLDENEVFTAWGAIDAADSSSKLIRSFFMIESIALLLIIASAIFVLFCILRLCLNFSKEEKAIKLVKTVIIFSSVIVAAYTVFTFMFSPINRALGGGSLTDVSFMPLLLIVAADIVYTLTAESIISYKANKNIEEMCASKKHENERKEKQRVLFLRQLELLIFNVAIFSVAVLAMFSKIVIVDFSKTSSRIPEYVISGKTILKGSANLTTQGERMIAYFVFFLLFISASFMLISFISFFSRSSTFSKTITSSIAVSTASCFLVGLFGQYYKIVQTLNKEIVQRILNDYKIASENLLKYETKSEALIYTFICLGILVILFIRKPLTKAKETEAEIIKLGGGYCLPYSNLTIESAEITEPLNSKADPAPSGIVAADPAGQANTLDFDPCPIFTDLDNASESLSEELKAKKDHLYESPSLPSLVSYIVQYARDSKHHLSYTEENIATFLSGLGATRLSILQGMSGTGKTSLPKIVAEALMSVCDIVEVESSWRDKNELLGYYNEFSKLYTPKKFTQALYKACLNPDTLTFIVLDEMNLSRIEYYFSDFLSLMENEPDKRELKLLNFSLKKIENSEIKPYAALVNGNTINIPQNIWFIGTANRDESTYDISDKVYDRAHTMNFDKRAPKPRFYGEPTSPRYLPVSELIRLFDEARENIKINIEDYPMVKKVEELLEPYAISYGNRVAIQIEKFVSIYAACFSADDRAVHDAFDIILLSKIVKKLELKSVEDKEELANGFEQIGLKRCADFVMSLKEDI